MWETQSTTTGFHLLKVRSALTPGPNRSSSTSAPRGRLYTFIWKQGQRRKVWNADVTWKQQQIYCIFTRENALMYFKKRWNMTRVASLHLCSSESLARHISGDTCGERVSASPRLVSVCRLLYFHMKHTISHTELHKTTAVVCVCLCVWQFKYRDSLIPPFSVWSVVNQTQTETLLQTWT